MAKKTPIPDDFTVSEQVRKWANERGYGPYLDLHLEHFVNYAMANGATYANWDAAFRNAIIADWGGVRRNAQFAEKRNERQPERAKNPFAGLINFGRN